MDINIEEKEMIKRKSLIQSLFLAALMISATIGTVNAATVVLDVTTATGITGLDIDPGPDVTLYDVDFVQTTAEALYGIHPATTFPFSLAESSDVNNAILAALDASAATSVGPASGVGNNDTSYAFMYSSADDRGNISFLGHGGSFVFGGAGWGDSSPVTAADTAVLVYADFTPSSVVPVPAAVWLFGSGLLGLIGIARRKAA